MEHQFSMEGFERTISVECGAPLEADGAPVQGHRRCDTCDRYVRKDLYCDDCSGQVDPDSKFEEWGREISKKLLAKPTKDETPSLNPGRNIPANARTFVTSVKSVTLGQTPPKHEQTKARPRPNEHKQPNSVNVRESPKPPPHGSKKRASDRGQERSEKLEQSLEIISDPSVPSVLEDQPVGPADVPVTLLSSTLSSSSSLSPMPLPPPPPVSSEDRAAWNAFRAKLLGDLKQAHVVVLPRPIGTHGAAEPRCFSVSCARHAAADRLACPHCTNSLLLLQLHDKLELRAERAVNDKGQPMSPAQYWMNRGFSTRPVPAVDPSVVRGVYNDVIHFNTTEDTTLDALELVHSTTEKIDRIMSLHGLIMGSFSGTSRAVRAFPCLAEPDFVKKFESLVAWSQTCHVLRSSGVTELVRFAVPKWPGSFAPDDLIRPAPDASKIIGSEINLLEVSGFMRKVLESVKPYHRIVEKWTHPIGLPDLRPHLAYLTLTPLIVTIFTLEVINQRCNVDITSLHGVEHYLALLRSALNESVKVQNYCKSDKVLGLQKELQATSFPAWLEMTQKAFDTRIKDTFECYLRLCGLRLKIILDAPVTGGLCDALKETLVPAWHEAKSLAHALNLEGLEASAVMAFAAQTVCLLNFTGDFLKSLPREPASAESDAALSEAIKVAGQCAGVALTLGKTLQKDVQLTGDYIFDGSLQDLAEALAATSHVFLTPPSTASSDNVGNVDFVEPWLASGTFACVPTSMHQHPDLLPVKLAAMLHGVICSPAKIVCTNDAAIAHDGSGVGHALHPCDLDHTAEDYVLLLRAVLAKSDESAPPAAGRQESTDGSELSFEEHSDLADLPSRPSSAQSPLPGAVSPVVVSFHYKNWIRRQSRSLSSASSTASPSPGRLSAASFEPSRQGSVARELSASLLSVTTPGLSSGAITAMPVPAADAHVPVWQVDDSDLRTSRQPENTARLLQRGNCVQVKLLVHSASQLRDKGESLVGLADPSKWHTVEAQTTSNSAVQAALDQMFTASIALAEELSTLVHSFVSLPPQKIEFVQFILGALFNFYKPMAGFLDAHQMPKLVTLMLSSATKWATLSQKEAHAPSVPAWLKSGLKFVAFVLSEATLKFATSTADVQNLQVELTALMDHRRRGSNTASPPPSMQLGGRRLSAAIRANSEPELSAAADHTVSTLHQVDELLSWGYAVSHFSLARLQDARGRELSENFRPEISAPFPVGRVHVATVQAQQNTPGNLFVEKWQITRVLGFGTFATVKLCNNVLTGAICAVKILNPTKMASALEALCAELRIMSQLSHPHLLKYLDIDERRLHIFTEYCPNGSLKTLIGDHGLNCDTSAHYLLPVLLGLNELHSRDLIHGDLKAENVLLDHNHVPKLADFGGITNWRQPSHVTPLMCTVTHAAPEVLSRADLGKARSTGQPRLPSSDIWSLGCLLIEMLTARGPYEPPINQFALIFCAGRGNLRPTMPSNCTAECLNFLEACLRNNPTQRPTCADLLNHAYLAPFIKLGPKSGDCRCGCWTHKTRASTC